MRVYIGWDARDELAFRACVTSLLQHSSVILDIYPIREYDLRRRDIFHRNYTVESSGQMIDGIDRRPFSTTFTFTRFAIPLIDHDDEWVLFCDADFLWFDDVAKLFSMADDSKALMCVQHDYRPPENVKFDGMLQQQYKRKNWSSLMLMQPRKCPITKHELNAATGRYLHQFQWLNDSDIGALPAEWNWLEGWSDIRIKPSAVHFTRGTPDMLPDLPYQDQWWTAAQAWHPDMNHHLLEPCGL